MQQTQSTLRAALAALTLCAAPAWASGFYFGENGIKALSQGGAFVATADDLTAIQHNPAGLSQLQGFHFLLDLSLVQHDVTFQRHDAGATSSIAKEVKNSAGLFFRPVAGLGYGFSLAGRPFTLAAGIYPPGAVGRYTYPTPNYTNEGTLSQPSYPQNPVTDAPQRYGLIKSDTVILYPSLSASFALLPQLSIGVSGHYVFSHLKFQRSVFTGFATPRRIREENPVYDSVVGVDLLGKPTATATVGVLGRPIKQLALGASFRPPVRVDTHGAMNIELGQFAREGGASVSENPQVDLSLTLPFELKVGAAFSPIEPLTLSAEFVMQGWSSFDAIDLVPDNVTLKVGTLETPLKPVHQVKGFQNAYSARVGAQYAFAFGLQARAGVLFETTAMPDEYSNVDFFHPTRVFLTAGAGYALGPVELVGVFAYTPTASRDVNDTKVVSTSTDPDIQGALIGNGTYSSSGWIGSIGIRGHFGGPAPQSAAPNTPPVGG